MNPSNLLIVFRRELAAYFNSAVAYIFIIVFVLLNGGLFMTQFFLIGRADMRPFFMTLPFTLSVFLPAVAMRLWAEEKKGSTFELLLTFPMTPQELVIGKFLASFLFYLVALAGTLSIPIMILFLGISDLGAMIGGYVGAAFMGAFFLAIGIFISGLCRDQIVAFIIAMMACFSLFLLGTEFIATSVDGWLPGLGTFLQNFLGTAAHFDSFAKGVVDNRDVLYFLIGTGLFLVLNGFWIEGRMRPRAKPIFISAALISIGIFLFTNWLASGVPLGRFDFSQGQIYSIAPASKQILRRLEAPVIAKLYISPAEKMPTGMKTIEQDVVDKFNEFRIASKGKFQYKIFRMEAAHVEGGKAEETLEQQISRKGIQPFQVQSIETDEVGVRLIYSAISLAYKEKPEEIIPQVVPDNLHQLEYLIISKIYRALLPSVPEIAMVAPYQEKTPDPQLQALMAQLGAGTMGTYREDKYEFLPLVLSYEGYEVSRIRLNQEEPIPENTKTLIVLEPQKLNERQQFEINRFLVNGGSVLMGVQNYEYEYVPEGGAKLTIAPIEKNPNVNPILSQWGLEVDEGILADAQHEVVNIGGAAQLGPFALSIPVKLPIQILVTPSGMNQDLSITSRLSSIFYLWGSALKINEEKIKAQNLEVKTLLSSSRYSWTVPFQPSALALEHFKQRSESPEGPFPLAVLAQGQFSDAFAGKEIPSWSAMSQRPREEVPKEVEESIPEMIPTPGKLILIGSATMFQKQLVRGGGHLNFFLNAMDALTLGDELVTIRSKQPMDRSIGRISSASKLGWKFFVMLFIPFVIAVAGFFRVFFRRQSKQKYMKALQQTTA